MTCSSGQAAAPRRRLRAALAAALALARCPANGLKLGSIVEKSNTSLHGSKEVPPPNPLFFGGNGSAKVVFFAGLQGAGHRLLDAVLKSAQPTGKQFNRIELPSAWACGSEWKPEGIPEMRRTFERLERGSVHLFDRHRSFPECGDPPEDFKPAHWAAFHEARRNLYHPRLDWIAQAAQSAGVDFRVVMLQRPMELCLSSNCMVGFPLREPCNAESDTLRNNAILLHEQLKDLNPSQVSCFMYEDILAMDRALQDTFGEGALRSNDFTKFLWSDARPNTYAILNLNWTLTLMEMRGADNQLRDDCDKYMRVTPRNLAAFVRAVAREDP